MKGCRSTGRAVGRIAFVAITVSTMDARSGPALAQEDAPGWSAHGSLTLKGGTERHIGELDFFLPVWQDNDTLLFGDLRAQTDDDGNQEGNIGLGLRQMGRDWIVGGYGFFDHRKSDETGNSFMQGTLGVEAMTEALDLRANVYIPESGEESAPGATAIDLVGSSLQMRAGLERALPGFDAEIGYRLMGSVSGDSELRIFAGGYRFSADGYETVAGPRGRMEARLFDLGFLGEGSRITLGAEVTYDDVRDTQGFAVARLTIPFGGGRRSGRGGLQRRMTDYVVRDVDVVTGSGATGTPEPVNYAYNGIGVGSVSVLDSTADLPAEAASRGSGDMIVVDGTGGPIVTSAPIVLSDGQVLLGGGSGIDLIGASSGARATYIAPGTRPTINGGALLSSDDSVIVLANNVIVSGLDIADTASGSGYPGVIAGTGITGALVRDNNIHTLDRYAIYLNNSDGNMVSGNSIITAGTSATGIDLLGSTGNMLFGNDIVTAGDGAYGVHLVDSTGNLVSDNSIVTAGAGAHGIFLYYYSDATFTGNAITTGQASAAGMYFDSNTGGTGTGNSYSGPGLACFGLAAVNLCQ